jgi:hypothetical protein
MRGTASTRTATRWWWCNVPRSEWRVARGRPGRPRASQHTTLARTVAPALAFVVVLGGCTQRRIVYFEPTGGAARISLEEARTQLGAALRGECPRLQQESKPPSGEARFALAVDSAGAVQRATLTQSAGDIRLDAELGTVAASLRLPAPASVDKNGQAESRLRMGYTCSATDATATVDVM